MKNIQSVCVLFCFIISLAQYANAQGFVNFNFEAASTQPSPLGYPFLAWSTAAPGWSHSSGGDTTYIYYGSEHLGLSQYYLLVDATSPNYAPGTQLAGAYSLAFASGHLNGGDFNSPWVNAYISQTGTIPAGTKSLQMLATGPFQVLVGGVDIPMFSLGGNSYGGDISGFAGTVAEIKIINTATTIHTPTIADNIAFSPVPVPEPSSLALLVLGAALLIYRRGNHDA